MRRILLFLVLIIGAASIGLVGGAAFLSRQNTNATARAEMLAADLQQLKIGISDYRVAQSIATNFGSVPYQNHYGTRDCKDGYFERCAYMIACDDTPLHRLLSRHPFLRRRLGFRDWGGTALIYVENGTVQEYSFLLHTGPQGASGADSVPRKARRSPNTQRFKHACQTHTPSNAMTWSWVTEQTT